MDDTPRTPKVLLTEIWAEFRKAKYEDDQEIIEYLAHMLTTKKHLKPLNVSLQIETLPVRYRVDEAAVQRLLDEAEHILENKGGLATFFHQYILFYPTKWIRKNTYPVPQHLVSFMLTLLQIEPDHHFADFACRQGGFLVNRHQLHPQHLELAVGIESSPEIARLAHANAVLHGMTSSNTILAQGNAFDLEKLILSHISFDRIGMAPPLEGTADEKFVKDLFPTLSDRSNRLLFTHLTLKRLKSGGKAILLVAASLLQNVGASRDLRKELIDQHTVHAIINLQAGIFQPYERSTMHMLLLQKGQPIEPTHTWFLHVANDGYPLNASRDLTADPPDGLANDLPLTMAALLPNTGKQETFQFVVKRVFDKAYRDQTLLYKPLPHTAGIVLKIHEETSLISIRYFQLANNDAYLVAQARRQGALITTVIPFSHGKIEVQDNRTEANLDAWKRKVFPDIHEEILPNGQYIFGQGTPGQLIAITADGRLLGFTRSRTEIASADYTFSDLYWNQHADPPQESISVLHTLQDIRENQRRITAYTESLQGQIAVKHLLRRPLPPKILAVGHFPLIASLGTEQQWLWNEIMTLVALIDGGGTTARHFQAKDWLFTNLSESTWRVNSDFVIE